MAAGRWSPLPEWDRFGQYCKEGALWYFAFLVWCLLAVTPLWVNQLVTGEPANGSNPLMVATLVVFVAVVKFLSLAVSVNFARRRTFGACFAVRELLAIVGRGWRAYVRAWAA